VNSGAPEGRAVPAPTEILFLKKYHMKVIFIMYLVYGIGNKTFYGCIYRKIKDPHILDEVTQML
jgi:hypothetical protein